MEKYKRLTKWEMNKGVKCVKYWQYPQEQIAERLALLEDKIENGTLIDTSNIWYEKVKDGYNLCKLVPIKMVIDVADTKAEAEKKIKELQKV